jgi:hypothetical protein
MTDVAVVVMRLASFISRGSRDQLRHDAPRGVAPRQPLTTNSLQMGRSVACDELSKRDRATRFLTKLKTGHIIRPASIPLGFQETFSTSCCADFHWHSP